MTASAGRASRELFARACRSFGQGQANLRWTDAAGLSRTAEVDSFSSLSLDPPLLLLTLDPRDHEELGSAPFEVHLAARQEGEGAPDSPVDLAVFECVISTARLVGERTLLQTEVRAARLLHPDALPVARIHGGPGRIEEAP